jgi:hypothetical protein
MTTRQKRKSREGATGKLWPGNFEAEFAAPPLASRDFTDMEDMLGSKLKRSQRQAIEAARRDYVFFQLWEWAAVRPRSVENNAKAVRKALEITAQKLSSLSKDTNAGAAALRELMAVELTFCIRHPQHQDALRFLTASTDSTSALREVAINQLLALVSLLSNCLNSIVHQLPPDRGGKNHAKSQFSEYISTLADIFESAGGSIAVSFKDSQGLYPMIGFLGFAEISTRSLPSDFVYNGLSFGREVSKALKRRKIAKT